MLQYDTNNNVSDFVQKHFVSATNVSQFAQPKKHYEQQCVRNNVSSFTRALKVSQSQACRLLSLTLASSQDGVKIKYISFKCVVTSINKTITESKQTKS